MAVLWELEDDGILERIIYPEIPPRVEYKLTDYGQSLMPVIYVMQDWGLQAMKSESQSPGKG